ncbi:MAG: Undecaprenyl-diphosphatase [Frankiales bacterium]|nr:Undecaprenyl-diphosphatase [Frankiales bacterium]
MTRTLPLALGDRGDFRIVNDFARHTGWLHPPVVAWARFGVALFAVLLVLAAFQARAGRDPLQVARALLAGAGTLLAVAVNQPLVHAVGERRPFDQLPDVLVLVHRSSDASFPSDHATMAGAVAAGLLLLDRRLGVIASVAALLMAFARVYVGVHFPLDVIAGLAVGAAVASLTQLLAPAVARLLLRLQRTAVGPLLLPPPHDIDRPLAAP